MKCKGGTRTTHTHTQMENKKEAESGHVSACWPICKWARRKRHGEINFFLVSWLSLKNTKSDFARLFWFRYIYAHYMCVCVCDCTFLSSNSLSTCFTNKPIFTIENVKEREKERKRERERERETNSKLLSASINCD